MGLYINTLPFRVDIDGSSVEDSVRKVQTDLATLLEHEHASLARAQRQSRIPSGTPLFSSLLNYRHNIVKTQTLQPDNGIHHIEAHERTNYPLTMSIEDNGQSLGLTCQIVQPYDPSRVCGYMHKVLQDLSNALEQSLEISMEKLDIMPAEERNMIIHSWNNTDRAYPSDQCLHQQFEEQARRNPEAIAVMHGDHSLTYEALNTRANQIAGTLIGMGIQPGDNVAILMERSIDLVATEIAILMAGAAYVPIDPRSPVERQVYIAMDCSAKIVVTDDTIGIPDKMELPILRLGASEAKNVSGITKIHIATSWTCSSMDTAYIMYTSGSTGQPKGVMVSKRGIARLVYNSGLVDIVFDDRVAFTTNPTFDISALEVWVPLLHGASIVIINNDTLLEAQRLSTAIDHYEITLLQLPTALFHQHAYVIGPTLSKLKYLICGGEQGLIDAFSAVVQYDGPVRFLNVYGPTEATVWATTYEVTRSIKDMERLPIGRPLGNTCVYVLDKHLVPVPIGVAGELYIGGPAVANGYLNRPHLAAKSFVPNIFSNVPGARMYKTGDLVRYLSDGNLVFLGRLDNQIKIRGFRVELGEIETRLVEHPDVREAIVITNGEGGDKQLVAYVVCDSRDVLSRVLREHLSTRIPEYMVPSAFVQLDSMPLTNNGKVDRSSLPDPGRISILAEKYVAPQGDTEITLAHIWSELLMVDCVGRHDNFFELGGHSLLAVRMLSIVRARMGVDLKLQSLFLTPTIAGLVQNPPLEDNNYDAFNVLLPLKTQGNRPPLFCVHPAFGASWSYRDLAQYLHPEQPLYGLQARGFDGKTPLASSIEEMTLDYIDQIRKIQPRGPYNLLGWSFGGPVAHNMALELEKCGEQVQLLAILDSLADYSELTDEGDEEEEENAITQVLSKLFADCMVSDLQLDVEDLRRRVSAVGTNNSRLLKYHIPSVVNADILFLRAAITGGNTHQLIDPTTWKPHTRNRLEVHDIQCTHGDMNKPEHLAAIGHVIRARLDVLQKSTFFRLIEM
ncbi:hypothetical protein BGW41_005376 [Actinomortierella wolfii]|nr:hypothetical protein BGW41_005376 [Actinomortierella wolfii]